MNSAENGTPRRYFLTLGYKGTGYLGWQRQQSGRTVQGVLEDHLSVMLGRPVPVTGAGRTDTGVHAARQVCHIDLGMAPGEARDLLFRANRFLPPDLRLFDIREVRSDAHARFDAVSRTYLYRVSRQPTPFDYELVTPIPASGLDFDRMNVAAAALPGEREFTTFSKTGTDVRTDLCRVTEAVWLETGEGRWAFRITANRFLRNMVRAIVGTLFDVGRGKMTPEDFAARLAARDRRLAASSAPARGLFLAEIEYPEALFL